MYNPITGTGSGTAPVVNLPWPFIAQSHVQATVNGSPVSLTWTGPSQVTFSAAVANGSTWEVSRVTPADSPLVEFTDNAVLTAEDLALAQSQALYRLEELQQPTVNGTPLAASSGAGLVGWIANALGAVVRSVRDRLRDTVSLKDFGAIGDGVANDTAAITAALAYIAGTGYPVYVPPGIYLSDPFQIAPQAYASQGFFYGLEASSTIIRRRATGSGAFVTIGSAAGTIFQAGLVLRGLTIDGGVSTNGDACVLYDVVRSQFDNVIFLGGTTPLHTYGGIDLDFNDCAFQLGQNGFVAEHFASSAGGGYPNLIRLNNPVITDNSVWGIKFDYGRMLLIYGGQVESNGTTLGAASGGIYVGPNVGAEVAINDTTSIGLVTFGTWFEANNGIADVHLNSGINSIESSNSFSNSTQTTNDIKVDGGRYLLRNLNSSFSKTANLLEGAGVLSGNRIDAVDLPNLSYDPTKTTLISGGVASFSGTISFFPAGSATPGTNGQMTWELTNNTTLKVKVKGLDGTVRSTTLTLS
jgi:hypothetical protein